MMSSGNIFSFPNGEPLSERLDPVDEAAELDPEICSFNPEHRKNILDRLERLRLLVLQGRVDGLLVVGQDPMTGYFLTETCLDAAADRTELFGFVGVLETLKLELTEQASMSPAINLAGAVVDPFFEADE